MSDCTVKFLRTNVDAILPTKAHGEEDACYDLSSVEDVVISPGHRYAIGTGFNIAIPAGWEGQVRSRSGNALKKGLVVLNSPGTIDCGYRGPVTVILYNTDPFPVHVKIGDRIAQIKFERVPVVTVVEVKNEEEFYSETTERMGKGFGSSGSVGDTK